MVDNKGEYNMSLIKCTECGKEFSVKADHCPNCGCPTWDIINELYKADQSININHEVYDVSEILSNIENGVDDQINIDAIAEAAEISASAAYCILQEIKEGNFLPWTEGGYGTLTNPKYQEKINQRNEQIAQHSKNVPHCPNCNSTNIQKISMTSRAISGLTFGILSSSIGKTFKCKSCGYKW